MPVYDWRAKGRRPPAAKFFDAATDEQIRGVFRWDSDTGRVDRFDLDDAGLVKVDRNADPVTVAEVRELRVEWKDGADAPLIVEGAV